MNGYCNSDDEANFIKSFDKEINNIPPNPRIFRVHDVSRQVNPKAYEPKMLAIGPYQHGKDNLSAMEEHKLRYLHLLLKRNEQSSVKKYFQFVKNREKKAREFYANSINLKSDDFVKMMLLDGCFIIELFRKYHSINSSDDYDSMLKLSWMCSSLRRDLMLFENQIPFFILHELFKETKVKNSQDDNIFEIAHNFLGPIMPPPFVFKDPPKAEFATHHLLHFMHECFCSPFEAIVRNIAGISKGEKLEFIKSATELEVAGIKFKKSEENSVLFNIKFENGVMKIPSLKITDNIECVFRNLIAYEQYSGNMNLRCVTDYTRFMDCLINSVKDVEKLRCSEVIDNSSGDDEAIFTMFEAIFTMFNKLSDNIFIDSSKYCYVQVFNEVKKHRAVTVASKPNGRQN